ALRAVLELGQDGAGPREVRVDAFAEPAGPVVGGQFDRSRHATDPTCGRWAISARRSDTPARPGGRAASRPAGCRASGAGTARAAAGTASRTPWPRAAAATPGR